MSTPPTSSPPPASASYKEGTSTTLLLALSGPSCSGKTTIARLLKSMLGPHAVILHEDDFYKPDGEIPLVDIKRQQREESGANGSGKKDDEARITAGEDKSEEQSLVQDWDSAGALDIPKLVEALRNIKQNGFVNRTWNSKEDQNDVKEVPIDPSLVDYWRTRLRQALGLKEGAEADKDDKSQDTSVKVVIVDGFLLFSEDLAAARDLFDIKLLLRANYETVKTRREARRGYVTIEGFWEDPEGYVDAIMWPNYVRDHAFLFKDGNVEGELDEAVCKDLRIEGIPTESVSNGPNYKPVTISEALQKIYEEFCRERGVVAG
ncbi:P-loop containing nucleoside triphosphate hydrolase protein [Trichodelitschia bisporula]|uniref:P-loop containing nucleoside triphosphate hydrolase protein n=1 Tax=Trichodelitschia bisporula TaxID=703511 RepID=A0A6G1IA43_9PEZI|nr:P-loop containing nucleoside triphosphate hydrolase protein [Trichodelitschia bisporula]